MMEALGVSPLNRFQVEEPMLLEEQDMGGRPFHKRAQRAPVIPAGALNLERHRTQILNTVAGGNCTKRTGPRASQRQSHRGGATKSILAQRHHKIAHRRPGKTERSLLLAERRRAERGAVTLGHGNVVRSNEQKLPP
eukprot:3724528-Pyramimonas_sp.AAC.1